MGAVVVGVEKVVVGVEKRLAHRQKFPIMSGVNKPSFSEPIWVQNLLRFKGKAYEVWQNRDQTVVDKKN